MASRALARLIRGGCGPRTFKPQIRQPRPSCFGASQRLVSDLVPTSAGRALNATSSQMPLKASEEDDDMMETLNSAVAMLGEEAMPDHPLVLARDKIAAATRDKAALLKRDWTDRMFHDGEEANEEMVASLEHEMAGYLGASGKGLEDASNLGGALDLVGVYMKNYKLDKAENVLFRCGPYVSARGGVWMVKWLNHTSTVRMKLGRHTEALEMLYELELYSPYNAEEAPEFFETLYRNLAWALKALGRLDEAAVYFQRMLPCSLAHKGRLDWFDCWDIGKLLAAMGFRDKNQDVFLKGVEMVEDSLRLHGEQEPEDKVMRAKVEDTLAECLMAAGQTDRAAEHYKAAYHLMLNSVGSKSPLFGKQARHSANFEIARSNHRAALPFLAEALQVEATKDAADVGELTELVDLLVNTQQKLPSDSLSGIPSSHAAFKALRNNLRSRSLDKNAEYGILCHKMSLVYLHESNGHSDSLKRAVKMAKQSVDLLQRFHGKAGVDSWLQMSELHLRMLASAYKSKRRS